MCSWDIRDFIRITAVLLFWPPPRTPIASLFRFPINSPGRWEGNSMVDDLDDTGSGGFDLQRYLGVVRRRHLHFLIPLFLGWAIVWGASWVSRRATCRAP